MNTLWPGSEALPAGSVLLHLRMQKDSALKFVTQYFLFAHATLATFDTHYDKSAVTIVPPAAAPGNKKDATRNRNRRVDEHVTLTAIGEAALKLEGSSRRKGQPKRDTVVWRFCYRCKGTVCCSIGPDGRCPCECRSSATPVLVANNVGLPISVFLNRFG